MTIKNEQVHFLWGTVHAVAAAAAPSPEAVPHQGLSGGAEAFAEPTWNVEPASLTPG